jgi:predicted HTH transcriptional regulator
MKKRNPAPTLPGMFEVQLTALETDRAVVTINETHPAVKRLHYPRVAGSKAQETSAEAAASTDAERLRDRVVTWLQAQGAQTADECAECLGCSPLAIRPRFSELLRLGRIRDTGMRRPNASSGKRAIVWELVNRVW